MCRRAYFLASVFLYLGLCSVSLGVELQVDIGMCYGATPQPGWLGLDGCRTIYNVGGTLIDFSVEVGFGPDSSTCECRLESGATHELKWVHQTFIMQDGPNPQPPNSDKVFTLSDLTPGAEYTLLTYHGYWDAADNVIDSITVTGATNVTKPSSILQNHDFAPGEFIFTAGSGDVVIRYSCLSGGQPYFNGFELYGGGTSMQFESASSGELETVTAAQIPVTINGPNESATYTVNYAVIGGTATGGGEDYTLDAGTLTFLPGSSVEFITIDINDDDVHEEDETIVIELSSPGGPAAALGSPTQHTYTIIDPRPDVLFWRRSGSGMEDVTTAYAPVRLTRPTRNTVTVNYAVIGGTADGNGVDYTLAPGTVVFGPNEINNEIPIAIVADSNDQEPIETIIIELSSPTNALLGSQTLYTHTIVSQPIDIQVDFALPYCPPDNDTVRPETAKPGWWIWAAPKWYDMYSHDAVWEDGSSSKPSDSGIAETGIHAAATLLREGDLGLKVSGLVMPNLDGGCPTSSPIYEPICNSWLQAVDWPTPDSGLGSIQLALYELPAGAYILYSYHNQFGCYRGSPVRCDCICNVVPPMPVIKAMSGKDAYELPHTQGSFGKLFPGYDLDALPEGVFSIQDACNVQTQQVTTDAELVPSEIRFVTDGSPVLVLYQGGCCEPDPVRDDRDGGRGILNAFRLVWLEDPGQACGPAPRDGVAGVSPDTTLSWNRGLYADSHDVYLGTDSNGVEDANTTETLDVYMGRQDACDCEYTPTAGLELGRTYYWRIDALNDANVWQGAVWSFTVDDGKATYLSPANGSPDNPPGVTLSWQPGVVAASHDVYLGTDFDGVEDANTSSAEFKDNLIVDVNTYMPAVALMLGQTYYWRIDAVNPGYSDSKGDVWSFSVVPFIVVDDMESYNTGGNMINDTWLDAYYYWVGAWLYLGQDPCEPVHSGGQSMKYEYENDGGLWDDLNYYSEAVRTFSGPFDWSGAAIEVLTLYFYGDAGNDAGPTEQMYVGLEDGSSYVQSEYGDNGEDMNDIKIAEWQEWNIRLQDFNDGGVDLSDIRKIYIGFGDRENFNPGGTPGGTGVVYFDDIRLYPRKCAASLAKPAADFDSNCFVDFRDLAILGSQWLQSPGDPSADIAPEVPDGVVDWRDLSALGNEWLEQQLWP
ncbi:MAG TPA: Calx-beta domain-containing protein [Sedimentisphaerales bacterium]|nr:Calx-beta domain-containing protein [Sedimentisphaerales bacterium]